MRVKDTDEIVRFEVVDDSPESDPAEAAVIVEQKAALEDCLNGLEALDREVLVKRYFEDKPYAEIAKELHTTVGTVRIRAYRALS